MTNGSNVIIEPYNEIYKMFVNRNYKTDWTVEARPTKSHIYL
jgi:hypothetical protein